MALAVASRYARALADLVLDPSRGLPAERAVAEIAAFEQLAGASRDLEGVLLSPAVAPARKRAVVERLAHRLEMSRLVRNFLFVIVDRRRAGMLAEIRVAFEALIDERSGAAEADVRSARLLSTAERESVALSLGRMTGKKVRCKFSVEESLIGGLVARIGSTIYDGSVRGQLDALGRRLTD